MEIVDRFTPLPEGEPAETAEPLAGPTDPAIVDGIPDATREAPYGYFKNGKPRKNPAKGMPRVDNDDNPPSRRTRADKAPKSGPEYPAFRAGPIAKGMNRLYFKAGRLISIKNAAVGQAFINSTLKVDDEDLTVGDAWEEIARTNPKIRAILMRLLEGNAWMNLFMAHLPILLAVMSEAGFLDNMPLGKMLAAFMSAPPSGNGEASHGDAVSDLLSTIDPADAAQIMGIAQGMMANITAGQGMPRTPTPGAFGFPTNFGAQADDNV